MMERLLPLLLASTLVASQTALASESELSNAGAPQAASRFSGNLPLPPIPYLDTMPWIGFGLGSKGPETVTLARPDNVPAIAKSPAFATRTFGNAEAQLSKAPSE